ncbi:HTH-type transcriptional repressor of iron proteins A [Legionella massiliensis]|uniref:HTH-type transcriptional repressor of iron proteins A n=1 Tax=Legionella massiliensis TaxID=1034943 RepID=A0A078KQB7_9GAMM|nr:AraC family transcriptional regulator [Legionella massiliensis]CDZ76575.1 HTH-type transcriptional repressor of iron proteins A [Legionella massiliensis]CEE12313.1 HTH-type transcriptional repressor of iron proteins A [Legionella massiliensis]
MNNPIAIHPLLSPYIKEIVVISQHTLSPYTVYPGLYPVIGLQYEGKLAQVNKDRETSPLTWMGITGLLTSYKEFKALSPSTKTVLVKLYPWGIPKFFKEPANLLSNQSLGLNELINEEKMNRLEEKIASADSLSSMINSIQAFFIELYEANSNYEAERRITRLSQELSLNPDKSTIEEIARHYGYSKRSLERHFLSTIGLSPKKFMRSARFQLVLSKLEAGASWSTIANDLNYYDQAHYIKEFREFSGLTPQQFRK